MNQKPRSAKGTYSVLPLNSLSKLFKASRNLYAGYTTWSAAEHIETVLTLVDQIEERVGDRYSFVLKGKDVLDVGAGQHLIQLRYFSQHNRAIGIDLDVIPQGFNPWQYVAITRANGVGRAIKTAGRKAVGIDYRHTVALRKRLGGSMSKLSVHQMDLYGMSFENASFDFVFCSSVFQHLADPTKALREITRVLRPGGVACLGLQLYTSETGSRDPELVRACQQGDVSASWAHLRRPAAATGSQAAHVNGFRLAAWRELFEESWPGHYIVTGSPDRARLDPLARQLQGAGELLDFSIDELVTHDLWVDWQKPVQ